MGAKSQAFSNCQESSFEKALFAVLIFRLCRNKEVFARIDFTFLATNDTIWLTLEILCCFQSNIIPIMLQRGKYAYKR